MSESLCNWQLTIIVNVIRRIAEKYFVIFICSTLLCLLLTITVCCLALDPPFLINRCSEVRTIFFQINSCFTAFALPLCYQLCMLHTFFKVFSERQLGQVLQYNSLKLLLPLLLLKWSD